MKPTPLLVAVTLSMIVTAVTACGGLNAPPIPSVVAAETAAGGLKGMVTDAAGNPVAKVPVALYDATSLKGNRGNPDANERRRPDTSRVAVAPRRGLGTPTARTVTDAQGRYEFPQRLNIGWYKIQAGTRPGAYCEDTVELKVGEVVDKSLRLVTPDGR